jgi:hypothetical protein
MAQAYYYITEANIGGTNGFTMSSIDQTYTDLVLVILGTASPGPENWLRFNGSSSNIYNIQRLTSSNSASVANNVSAFFLQGGSGSGNVINQQINIFNYTNTTTFKSILVQHGNGRNDSSELLAGTFNATGAITSLTVLFDRTSTWAAGSKATLYGIRAA